MPRPSRWLSILPILLICAACGHPSTPAGPQPHRPSSEITAQDIQKNPQFTNLYDLIAQLRPGWVLQRGPSSLMSDPGAVQVHMNGNWLGTVDVLRNVSPAGVTSIQWLSPVDAGARFGFNHAHGAIVISTNPTP